MEKKLQERTVVLTRKFIRFEVGGWMNACEDGVEEVPSLLDLLNSCYDEVVNNIGNKEIRFIGKEKIKELISAQMVMDYLNNQEEPYYNLFNLNDMGIAVKKLKKVKNQNIKFLFGKELLKSRK